MDGGQTEIAEVQQVHTPEPEKTHLHTAPVEAVQPHSDSVVPPEIQSAEPDKIVEIKHELAEQENSPANLRAVTDLAAVAEIQTGANRGSLFHYAREWQSHDGKDIPYIDQIPGFMKWLYNNKRIRNATSWLGRLNRWINQKLLLPFWGAQILNGKNLLRATIGMPLINPDYEERPSLKREQFGSAKARYIPYPPGPKPNFKQRLALWGQFMVM